MKQFDKENVPNGFYKFEKPGCDYTPIVHVMEIGGQRVVSFINKDYPKPLKEIPKEIKFVQSAVESNLGIPPEEIEGRERELCAYLLESLQEDPNLRVTRGDKKLCVSRMINQKRRVYFILNIELETIEIPGDDTNADEESQLYQ